MGIHQPCSDVYSGVSVKGKKKRKKGKTLEFSVAIYKSLTLQLSQWIVKSVQRQICSFPFAAGLTEENSAGCHYWTVSINLHLLALGSFAVKENTSSKES